MSKSEITPQILERLRQIVGEAGVHTDEVQLQRYGRDETELHCFLPQAVVLPSTTDQVSGLLTLASAERLPVTPRGGGTGLSGGALPIQGGLVLSLERLDRIRSLDQINLVAEVEAGVVTGRLQREVEAIGLFYPPDPASRESCQIGGNLAEDAAGPRSCKYGSTRHWVLGLEAVLASGAVVRCGGRYRKNATGYDLSQLLVGSEGTLAIITAATLKLAPVPPARLTLCVPFGSAAEAAAAVPSIFSQGIDPSACELIEAPAIEIVARLVAVPPGLGEGRSALLVELDGDEESHLLTRAETLARICMSHGAEEPLVASDAADQRRLWQIRERIPEAVRLRSAYKEADTVVPRSALAELIDAAHRIAGRHGIEAIVYGHAGDGNLHVNLLRGDRDAEDWAQRRDAAEEALFRVVAGLGGNLTGEHGVGWTQRRYLGLVCDQSTIDCMSAVKRALDPLGILNPSKIFPPAHKQPPGHRIESGSP